MKTMEQLAQELDAKIPRECVSTRDAGNGRTLDYLAGHYVIDRLNKVVGHGNWSYDSNVNLLHSGTIQDRYGKDVYTVHYSARILLVVRYPNGEQASYVDYGYGDGSDKVNPGKAHELAIKESITDGLKRCAKNLGMSFGLALYSKEQENVEETPTAVKVEPLQHVAGRTPDYSIKGDPLPLGAIQATPSNRKAINDKITAISRVIIAKKLDTADGLRAKMKTQYSVDSKEALSDTQASELLSNLQGVANGQQ